MNKFKNKKIILIIAILIVIATLVGGTFAWWTWRSGTNTTVTFTVAEDFSCSADGGGNITSNDINLIPTDCTITDNVIKRTIKTTVNKNGSNNIYMDLWLNINSIGSYLSGTENFKYTLSTEDSCTSNIIANGNFLNKTSGNKIYLLNKKEHTTTASNTYYLYIWLDKAETVIPPSDETTRTIDLSLGGECTNEAS